MLGEDFGNPIGREEISKWQSFSAQEDIGNLLEIGTATGRQIWYRSHEKTLLGRITARETKEGLNFIALEGEILESLQVCAGIKTNLAQAKINLRASQGLTVPFGSGAFFTR